MTADPDPPAADLAFGTADLDAPVPRRDLERALRHQNLADLDLREAVLLVGARVIALMDELTRRLDGVEPEPAPPDTPATPSAGTIEQAVARQVPDILAQVRGAAYQTPGRVLLDRAVDKYTVPPSDLPCAELVHLCHARCCTYDFALSTQDLDEGIVRWDYGQPYRIRQRASDHTCVHCDPESRACTIHEARPRTCRSYDCRKDPRVWIDFEQRIPAPLPAPGEQGVELPPPASEESLDLETWLHERLRALQLEQRSMSATSADPGATRGSKPRT